MNFKTLLLICAPFLCFIFGYLFCSWYFGNKTYPTPDLIGLSVHESLLKTSPLQINLQLIAQKEHNNITPGTIISQKPAPGRLIKQHQSILITASKIPDKIKAPDACKLTKSELQSWCKQHNVKLKSYDIPSDLPSGHYIGQYPCPKDPIIQDSLIVYYAVNQQNFYLMPNFCNQNIESVLAILKHYELPAQIFYKNELITNFNAKSAIIITQKPTTSTIIDICKKPTIQFEIDFVAS